MTVLPRGFPLSVVVVVVELPQTPEDDPLMQ